MPIFNETFTDDKPIYYPSTWETGKTAPQLYQEWKLTTEYFILSNILQCVIAGLWLCFVFVICSAIKQVWRLYTMDKDKLQRIANRQYISKNFIMSTSFIAFMVFSVTVTLLCMSEFTRFALIKGFFFCIFVIILRQVYKKAKNAYISQNQRKNHYQSLKKQEQQ